MQKGTRKVTESVVGNRSSSVYCPISVVFKVSAFREAFPPQMLRRDMHGFPSEHLCVTEHTDCIPRKYAILSSGGTPGINSQPGQALACSLEESPDQVDIAKAGLEGYILPSITPEVVSNQ